MLGSIVNRMWPSCFPYRSPTIRNVLHSLCCRRPTANASRCLRCRREPPQQVISHSPIHRSGDWRGGVGTFTSADRARDLHQPVREYKRSTERWRHLGKLLTLIFARRRAEFCSQRPSLSSRPRRSLCLLPGRIEIKDDGE